MLLTITTAGFDKDYPCYELRTYCTEVLAGAKKDDSLFTIIYTLDDKDDWKDPTTWIKANPNLGVTVHQGALNFEPTLLLEAELLRMPDSFSYLDVKGKWQTLPIPADSLVFTFCQVPVIISESKQDMIHIIYDAIKRTSIPGTKVDREWSKRIFERSSSIEKIEVEFKAIENTSK